MVAYFLKHHGMRVTVLERDSRPGGTMRTIHQDGWLVEAGPNSALETTPLFQQVFRDIGIADQVVYANEASNNRYILRGGRLHVLPMNPVAFLRSRLWSWRGKLRLLKEPFIGRADKPETVAEFVSRRLGREFHEYAIDPFVAGVYAGKTDQLSVQAAFPKLHALEEKYGGLVKGMVMGRGERRRRVEKAKDRARLFSFVNGMQTFPAALAVTLGEALQLNTTVHRVERRGRGYAIEFTKEGQVGHIVGDVLVLSVPSYAASELVKPLDAEFAGRLVSIYYPPVTEVFLGFRAGQVGRPLDGFGFLVPTKENRKILGTIWSSAILAGRAPEGCVALTTFVGGAHQPELALESDSTLLDVVSTELQSIMGVKGSPVYASINRWQRAIPQYELGHTELLKAMIDFEQEFPGLYLCANYRGGISVGDCMVSAERTASRLLQTA